MKYLIFLAMLFVYASQAEDIAFKRAVPSDFGKTQRTSEEKLASPIISQVVKSQGLGGSLSLAYTNMSSGSVWFRLYDNFSVYAVDISKKEFIGSWSLRSPLSCEGEDADCKKQWW